MCVDRTFPPESPNKCKHFEDLPPYSIFHRLLRPEYLQLRKQQGLPALSSDALSAFAGASDFAEHDKAVEEATRDLFSVVIPKFAKDLVQYDNNNNNNNNSNNNSNNSNTRVMARRTNL